MLSVGHCSRSWQWAVFLAFCFFACLTYMQPPILFFDNIHNRHGKNASSDIDVNSPADVSRSFETDAGQSSSSSSLSYDAARQTRDKEIARRLSPLLSRNATADDPDLIRLIRDMLDPPCNHEKRKTVNPVQPTLQSSLVDTVLNKDGGFYVECGAFDGEQSSNTLYFETKRRWTGLLVEVDPYYYTQLVGKCRSAWSINACLSTTRHVQQLPFVEAKGGNPQVGKVAWQWKQKKLVSVTSLRPCFPLEAILQALNRTHIDYFSLDIEGLELDVLKTIPFKSIDILALSVEYSHGRTGKQSYVDFMAMRGYTVYNDTNIRYAGDFIFTKSTKSMGYDLKAPTSKKIRRRRSMRIL